MISYSNGKVMFSQLLSRACCSSIVLASLLCLSSCTKSGTSDSKSSSGGTTEKTATTACGIISNGKLQNPISLSDGQLVDVVDILSNNLVAVTPSKGGSRILVKLQGVESASSNAADQASISTIKRLASDSVYFFKATADCESTVSGGGTGTIGSLVTKGGLSIAEELIKSGSSPVDSNDACRGELLGSCFKALDDSNEDNQTSSNVGCGFLWKPIAEKDGKLVVLVDECSVRVFVNGQELRQAGASNGRCTTVRGDLPGCAYGEATVEIFDAFTSLPYVFKGGKTKLTINGCSRFELPCT
jgi:hypothetical protein